MKFLILSTDYTEFLHRLYAQHPGLERQPYEQQTRVRCESLFGTADFYSSNLQKLGYDAEDIIANVEPAQKQWAREHGLRCENTKWRVGLRMRRGIVPWPYCQGNHEWLPNILEAQVKAYRPDVLYCMDIETVGSNFLRRVKGYYRLAVGQHAAPLPTHDIGEYDLMLSSLPNQVDYFRSEGMTSELFRLGFEHRVLTKLSSGDKRFDVVFVGNLGGPHQQGTQTLEYLCRRNYIKVWAYSVGKLIEDSPIRGAYIGPASGIEMYQVLRSAKIAFNRHIDVAGDYANNLRLYEATGVGTLLITDWKANLHEMFEPDKEVVAYRSSEECAEMIQHYLEHDEEREAIARAGQQRTLRDHTYYKRMQELVDIVQKYL
jgi:spore maturation protein CgeB